MDRLREAMERAIEESWEAPIPLIPDCGKDEHQGAPRRGVSDRALARMQTALNGQQADVAGDRVAFGNSAEVPAHQSRWNVSSADAGRPHARGVDAFLRAPAQAHDSVAVRLHVPPETFARSRLVAALPDSREREAYCLLQAAIGERLDVGGHAAIGVTGPTRRIGKTLTAANLAITLAADAGRPTVLIDLDLTSPSLTRLFGTAPTAFIEDCLFNGAPLESALFSPSIENLAVLAARGGSKAASQILHSSCLEALLAQVRRRWPAGLLVLDLPPAASRSEAAVLGGLADTVLLVVEDGVTRESDYRRSLDALGKSTRWIGTVLNRAAASV